MNKRDFVSQMREHYLAQIPNLKADFDLKSVLIEPRVASPRRFRDALRLPWRFAMKFAVLALLGLFTYLLVFQSPANSPTVLAEIIDIYAFQAISSTDLLFTSITSSTTPLSMPLSVFNLSAKPAIEDDLDDLNKYLNMIEQFLGNDTLLTANVAVSELPEYAYKLTYTSVNLMGEAVTYMLYYNETALDGSVVPDYEFTDAEDEDVTSLLDGMMTIGTVTYYLEGKRIQDPEEDAEIILFRSYIDHDNYVSVRYLTDDDGEQKFFYSVVQAGVTLNRSKLHVTTEDDKVVTKLEFIEGNAKGKYTFRESLVEGVRQISVRYEIQVGEQVEKGEARVQATLDPLTGTTAYSYVVKQDDDDEEHEYEKEREQHGHGHEDDDEIDDEEEDEVDEDENDEPGNDEPGNDEPGNDEPGNDDDSSENEQDEQEARHGSDNGKNDHRSL